MSHYINSFLIEPVVRQARRFSRPSDEDTSPHPTSRQLQPEDPNQTRPQVGPNIAWGSRSWRSNPERPGPHAPLTPNPDHFVLSGDFEDGSDEAVMDTRRDTEQLRVSFQHSGISLDDDATGSDRSEILSSDDRVSINPVYGVPESLRSTTSSLGESAESNSQGVLHLAGAAGRSSSDAERHYTQGREGQLPADDGMGLLRKRIVAIQRTDSSSVEKARMVHELMTEQYNSSQPNLPTFRARSPASLASHERPLTPGSIHSLGNNSVHCTSPLTSLASVAEASNPFNLAPGDLRPTFYQKPTLVHTSTGAENPSTDRLSDGSGDEAKPLGCPHYKRNIKLQCSACHRWYTCRFCHDEVEDHSLNRRETKNMLCMLCGSAQPASEHCIKCTKRSARYYCSVCKLWDDDAGKSIYHCADCGICRIGQGLGKDFYHCKTCCVCLSIGIQETHRCIERSTDCDCPICGEYMFTSPQTVVFMGCGHSIHHRCYYEHMKRSYRCPICSRSIVNMEMQFRHLERAIESQPMPPEFQDTKAWVYCNDCNAKSSAKYHWLGLKCGVCDSYNTAQLQMIHGPSDQRDFPNELHPPPQSRGRASDISAQMQRTTNSAPPAAGVPPAEGPFDALRRTSHSQGPQPMAHYPVDGSRSPLDDFRETMGSESDEEDYSDVDFWGLESPRTGGPIRLTDPVSGASEDEEESDEDMSDDDDADGADDQGQGEDEDEDDMEVFGHR